MWWAPTIWLRGGYNRWSAARVSLRPGQVGWDCDESASQGGTADGGEIGRPGGAGGSATPPPPAPATALTADELATGATALINGLAIERAFDPTRSLPTFLADYSPPWDMEPPKEHIVLTI